MLLVYLFSVGLYDELPSDIFKHLEYFKKISTQIDTGNFKPFSGTALLNKSVLYWYHLPILISEFIENNFLLNMEIFAAINIVVLLVCVYEFSNWLYKETIPNRLELLFLSMLSVLFFAIHFGVNVFAFIRYYSIAPTILNYAIYLTAIVCLFNYYRFEFRLSKFLLIAWFLFFAAYLIHAQEAMFIGTIYFIVTVMVIFKNSVFKLQTNINPELAVLPRSIFPISIISLLLLGLLYFYAINYLPIARIIKPKVIPLSDLIGIGNNYFVLNPFIQFYTVLTHWGLYIYFLYIVFYKKYFANQTFLLAAMLIPIITVFNPIFTNFFLRIGYSDVLWRFLYMLPLNFVAARLVIALCYKNHQKLVVRITNSLIALLIFVFLFPINISSINLPYSRFYSLVEIHQQAQPQHWQDMLKFLNKQPNKESIITDPISGYLITALTKHDNRRYKFHTRRMRDPYIFESYTDHPLKKYSGKLLIINQREGMSTNTANVSRHWNPRALKLTEYYSDTLLSHIEKQSQHFEILWEAHDIKIYRISY